MQTSCWCGLGKSQKQNCPGPPGLTGHLVRAGSCCLPLRAEQRGLGQRLGLRCTREVEVQGWRGPWETPGDRRGPAAQEGERWPPPGLHFTDTRWTWLSVGSGERVRAGARGSPEMVLLAPEEEMGGRDRDGLRGRRRQLASWRPPCPPPPLGGDQPSSPTVCQVESRGREDGGSGSAGCPPGRKQSPRRERRQLSWKGALQWLFSSCFPGDLVLGPLRTAVMVPSPQLLQLG